MALTPLRSTDPDTLGPYKLQGRLGAGGMGVVYLAFGPDGFSDGTAVALKVLQPVLAQNEEYRHRFIREVTAAGLVSSPHVARVVASETESDPLWMATEYVEGATLRVAVESNGPIPPDRLRGLGADLAAAVDALHVAGLVHRDLKPANVVLAWSGPKLIDFGIAKHLGATELTQAGMAVGSPMWMSPEVLAGAQAAQASDVFGWGLCIAFAGLGKEPFGSGDPNAVAYRIMSEQPDLKGLPRDIRDLVAAALSKDPALRPRAEALAAALGSGGARPTAIAIPREEGGWTGPKLAGQPPTTVTTPVDSALGAPEPGATEPGTTPPEAPPAGRRRRVAIALAIVAVLLIAAAGVVVGLLVAGNDGNKTAGGKVTPSAPATGSATPSTSGSPSSSPTPSPTPTPSTAPPVLASLTQAEAVVADDGYEAYPNSATYWDPQAPINVILASLPGSADGNNNWAYFFAGNVYLGHDTPDPSIGLSIVSRTKTTITLAYQIYGPTTPLCCPTLPAQNVTFQYLNGVFKALNPIPSSDPSGNHR